MPGGAAAVLPDLSEDRVGEVAAVAERVGFFQLGDEATAVDGSPGGVVVEGRRPFRVVHLDRRVQGVAEGDQALPPRRDDVLSVPGRVARGRSDVHAREDLLSVRHGTYERCQRRDFRGHALVLQDVAVGPLRGGHQVVGVGESGPFTLRGGVDGPAHVIGVEVGERDRLDRLRPTAEPAQALQQAAPVNDAARAVRSRGESLRSEASIDEQGPFAVLHQQSTDACHEVARGVEEFGVGRPDFVCGVREQGARAEPYVAVRYVGDLRVTELQRTDLGRPA